MGSGRTLPRTEHLESLRPLLGAVDRPGMGAGRIRGGRCSLDEAGRRARHVGAEAERLTMERPAFYAARSGGWRDVWTLLHPPYTAWHLSYVVIGGCFATPTAGRRLRALVLRSFFA